ncbi:protein SCO1/2 [Flavobacterium sp. 90]|uniref:SCO family protein n=1 Tax=unclassified Flavobacterium TaxID=196869 RepID=UPI000EAB551E|nr:MULTISPECIES: SCO family protein [unclassified Flavobacterium]RKR05059.1 protein SCO1/2 [Flavobacterium sp. 81]TCK56375.1 protein SCO1/2 [Flavobacterium sp. 90]
MKIEVTIRVLLFALIFAGCTKTDKLPILGEVSIDPLTGKNKYYQAPEFLLKNQFNQEITHHDFENKIQIVDFFFTSCPTICPKMTKHLKLVEKAFEKIDKVAIVSYSIDYKNDSPETLKQYSKNYKINNNKWTFLTGESDAVFELSKDYKVRAFDDGNVNQRNIIHDGTFVLVDGKRRIRGYYDGLSVKDTKRLILDINKLIKEVE